jgi:hypothetical protein
MRKVPTAGLALAALAIAVGATEWSCSQTPTNVPIRTFEGAQKVAVVCLQVLTTNGQALPPGQGAIPVPENNCAPVASGVAPGMLPFHLIAAVTQTTRGELAIVDLTGGYVVDEDQSTPGTNFIPVGTNPTDVAIPPDGSTTYVSSAAANKPAIYAIPSRRLLGDSTAVLNPDTPPLQLTDLLACSLPQPPLALAIEPLPGTTGPDGGAAPDGGVAPDGGAAPDGGVAPDAGPGVPMPYTLVALLGSEGTLPPRVVTLDPTASFEGKPGALPPCTITGSTLLTANLPSTWSPGPAWPDGVPYVDGGVDIDGQLPPVGPQPFCSSAPLSDAGVMQPVDAASEAGPPEAGPTGPTGDGGPDGEVADGASADGAVEDGATEDGSADAGVLEEAGPGETGAPATPPMMTPVGAGSLDAGIPLALAPLSTPNPSSMVMRTDLPVLYVSDESLPMIHVVDLSNPATPVEIEPLLATSLAQPARAVRVGALALSPPTRDFKRYLYAVDLSTGSLIVYDVTNGAAAPHVPLVRPAAALNPFAPIDRIVFPAPVVAVTFAQHDWPAQTQTGSNALTNSSLAYTGLLCNPNPTAHPNATTFQDLGAYYRVDQAGVIQPNGNANSFPTRLRGVFGFATMSNGTVATIDVDDWDAPCRRPDPMVDGGITGSLDVPQPDAGTNDLDPYHTPLAYQGGTLAESPAVTLEPFFPVSQPHRLRSNVLLRNDPSSGNHVPNLVSAPQLTDINGAPVVTSGMAGTAEPLLLPTVLQPGFADPSAVQNPTEPQPGARVPLAGAANQGTVPNPMKPPTPSVRVSFDDPTVQFNQDWTVTYEGTLPSSNGILADIASSPPGDYTTLTFSVAGANLCALGIEDWSIGQAQANAALEAIKNDLNPSLLTPQQKSLPTWTTDYVEITDDILPEGDPYWSDMNQTCWGIPGTDLADGGVVQGMDLPTQRFDVCQATFGGPGTNPDTNPTRDAPILEAYTDHLRVGRFGRFQSQLETPADRSVDPGSPNNPTFLKLMACCFHNQAKFKVRAGGEWIAVGQQGVGLLHHVRASVDPATLNRCVLSCDPNDALLNARSFDVPWGLPPCTTAVPMTQTIDRNNVLAMRNPMFSYVTWGGCGAFNGPMTMFAHTLTPRDLTWKFSMSGGFSPLTIPLSGANGATVAPQSMLFISSLGQIAVVDGSQQGLVLIDLNTVAFSTNYF